ncbi:MAG TPA: M20/M25/M40 family metallo-hydrolase [Solirubrobacteraceae bacterium]|nr:M20/M25/M40 family metallo-hydrolase [Solirubrobacteraceae bacterium]
MSAPAQAARAPLRERCDELERRYVSGTFAELCRIESPSGSERACAQRVIAELRALGVRVHEDDAGPRAGSNCGNLLARIPADAAADADADADAAKAAADAGSRRSVLLCAHLDTVPLDAPVEPVLVDGFWENANDGVLGADNKAAVAVLLALARHVRAHGSPVDLELLFTVGEEVSLAGSRAFDASALRSDFGYVFDHASPIGEIVTESPTHFRVQASFRGAAAHAGIRPHEGRSAILAAARAVASLTLGRHEDGSTVNVGTIAGGSAINVVPEHCSLLMEARAMGDERAEALVGELVDRMHEAANLPDCDCDLDVEVQRTFSGFRLSEASPAVRVAQAALRACGHQPVSISSGGASDANELLAQGVPTVNLANGTERNHEPGERVSVLALEQMLDVALALLDEAASDAAREAAGARPDAAR